MSYFYTYAVACNVESIMSSWVSCVARNVMRGVHYLRESAHQCQDF